MGISRYELSDMQWEKINEPRRWYGIMATGGYVRVSSGDRNTVWQLEGSPARLRLQGSRFG
jgi:hypothetical protein